MTSLNNGNYATPPPPDEVNITQVSIAAIADAVWDELTNEHQLPDSFGELEQKTFLSAKRAGSQSTN